MKICVLYKKNPDESLTPLGAALVHDDHQFGWMKEWGHEALHYEVPFDVHTFSTKAAGD